LTLQTIIDISHVGSPVHTAGLYNCYKLLLCCLMLIELSKETWLFRCEIAFIWISGMC